jgi:hypothetical protein
MCGYAVDGVRLRHFGTPVRRQKGNQFISTNAANHWRKRMKHLPEHCLPIIGIITAPPNDEENIHDVKKGTLSDDESYVVRQGTEANRLIASAAGLEAFIPNGNEASGRVNSRVGSSSRTPGETLLGESIVQVVGSE